MIRCINCGEDATGEHGKITEHYAVCGRCRTRVEPDGKGGYRVLSEPRDRPSSPTWKPT